MKNLNKDTKIIFQVSISILDNGAQYGNFTLSHFLVLLPRSCAWAANEYFVSPGGSDAPSIPGSESSPWQTISQAFDQVRILRGKNVTQKNAATITLKAGIYFQPHVIKLGWPDAYLTIQNLMWNMF